MALPIKGRCMVVNSTAYTKWQKEVAKQLIPYWNEHADKGWLPLGHANIEMTLYAPDRRASDLSNKFESVADALVTSGFIKDDSWFILDKVTLLFGGVDVDNPRAEITIYE